MPRARLTDVACGELADLDLRDPEVEDLHEVRIALTLDEHDVLGLQVAMDDLERVCARQRGSDLARDMERSSELEPPGGDHLTEALALHELEREEERAVLELAEVRRRDDVRMIDVRRCHRFPLEARDDLRLAGHLRVEHLDRHALAHERVLGLVHRAHAALTEEALDLVAIADRAADERLRTRLGRRSNAGLGGHAFRRRGRIRLVVSWACHRT